MPDHRPRDLMRVRGAEIRPNSDSVSVVICAYTEARWPFLVAAVKSVAQQTLPPDEVIVVIDHNEALLARARATFRDAQVTENRHPRGISGARNTGIAASQGSVVAFLDDDAVADADWLEKLMAGYTDPRVLGVGGSAHPLWLTRRPAWFPAEFLWVLGCSHLGTPQERASVRNFWGCNMSLRRTVLEAVGEFRTDVGRLGGYPIGCEETELCIRISQRYPEGYLLYEPAARVHQHVTAERATRRYFFRRCYAEGLSKALISGSVGTHDALADERAYTLKVLPRGVARGLRDALAGRDPAGLARAGTIVSGLAVTAAGYVRATVTAKAGALGLGAQDGSEPAATFEPLKMAELELGEPLPDLPAVDLETGARYRRALVLVRLGGHPLGTTEVELGLPAAELADRVWNAFSNKIKARYEKEKRAGLALTAGGLTEPTPRTLTLEEAPPLVSVVVATRDRTESLAVCLGSLGGSSYPTFEVIVVDNAPSDARTHAFLQANAWPFPLKYVREDIPGLAAAHNCGLREAAGDLVAFTDDDVRVDRHWLKSLVAGFRAADRVGCVTGMIVAAEVETPAQTWIEQYGGFSKGFELKAFNLTDRRPPHPLFPYAAGIFGSGANMAFTRDALRAIGGFDAALGAGSKGVSGDDLAAFFDVVTRGYTLVYQPAAIVHHWHRRDYEGLRRQIYGYGVGLTAFLTKAVLERPRHLLRIAPLIPRAVAYTLSPTSSKNAKKGSNYPRDLLLGELKGMLYGPFAYLRSRRHLHRLKEQATPSPWGFYRPASAAKVTR